MYVRKGYKTNKKEDLWKKVDRSGGPGACWPFIGALGGRDKRGLFSVNGTLYYVHRLAYELEKGPLKHQALHTCDTTHCCNPAHIYDGTQQQNIQDRVDRRRDGGHKRTKENNGRTVLTEYYVSLMKEANAQGIGYGTLGKLFNVHKSTVAYAIKGYSW